MKDDVTIKIDVTGYQREIERLRRDLSLSRLDVSSLTREVAQLKREIHARSTCSWCGERLLPRQLAELRFTAGGVYCSDVCSEKPASMVS